MDDKNELNDIVLNKTGGSKPAKKIILVIAVLIIILIIVISLFETFSSNTKHHIQAQQTKLPALPQETNSSQNQLFQPAKVITQNSTNASSIQTTTAALNKIAQKLKQQSMQTANTAIHVPKKTQKPVSKSTQPIHHAVNKTHKQAKTIKHYSIKKLFAFGHDYIQVGAFVRFHPSKKFLASIKKHGYSYTYKKQNIRGKIFTKVLIGPFSSKTRAKKALVHIKQEINSQAYIVRVR